MLVSDKSPTAVAKIDVCLSECVRKSGQAQQEYINHSNVMGKACTLVSCLPVVLLRSQNYVGSSSFSHLFCVIDATRLQG